ncbi:DUF6161 domain-containing protein [Phenylobacterium sp.]|uniref:DUF6161 domain-containing protein n=1 Tax=Phenylobacterium sp. TaxID=1871053 RepID=UPI0025D22626|nr:DUF6161 domain-containing protein [Phenylobacterium sp.]
MSEALEIDLGELGGSYRFRSLDQFLAWIEQERTRWSWLNEVQGRDNFGLMNFIGGRLNYLRDQSQAAISQGQRLPDLVHMVNQVYVADQGNRILHSEGDYGRRVLDIFEAEGPFAGSAAYAVATNRANLANVGNLAQITGALLVAAPSLIRSDVVSRQLTQERRNLRDRTDRLLDKLEDEAGQRWVQHRDDRLRGRKVARRWAKRQFGKWRSQMDTWLRGAVGAQADFAQARETTKAEFDNLRATFLEFMRLQAPAQYWSDKAARHKTAEDNARRRLYVFFPLLAAGLTLAFVLVAVLLLEHPPGPAATPLYFIISAGLGTLAGVSFWVGRLLTKLYLSEHHLRVDAEEREIMTTTYLALTKDQAADEKDRQIILTALFRTTPDGIVKDDGMADGTIAALLARLISPTK